MNNTEYAVVKVGDFVKSSLNGFECGFVVAVGHACGIYGFMVELANGKTFFLPVDYTLVFTDNYKDIGD